MTEKTKSSSFVSGGRQHTIRFTFNALAQFEELTGTTIMEILVGDMAYTEEGADSAENIGANVVKRLGMKTVRELVWAGLLHQYGALTFSEAGEIMDGIDASGLMGKFTVAMEAVTTALSESINSEAPKRKKKA